MIFAAYILCNLGLAKLKTERQTVQAENLTEKLQNSFQNSC